MTAALCLLGDQLSPEMQDHCDHPHVVLDEPPWVQDTADRNQHQEAA